MPLSDWLNIDLTDGHITLLPVVMLALTTGAAIKIGRIRRRGGAGRRAAISTAAARSQVIRTSLPAGLLDVDTELRAIVRNLEELAVQRRVVIELATQPHLTVRSDRTLFCDTMNGLLMHAIGRSAGGRVLLGAFRDDRHIRVIVADDGRIADPSAQPATLRVTERLAAQQGATLEIDPKGGEGTTVMLRMAATEGIPGQPVSDAARVCG